MTGDFGIQAAVRPDELPEDLRARAKELGDRKILRLLDAASYAPFVAAVEACRLALSAGEASMDRVALFTVSSWDPSVPAPPFPLDEAPDLAHRLSRHFYQPENPSDWLRRMPNNPLCQVAIATGLRGPNMHFVGDASSLVLALAYTEQAFADDDADLALVVAYDQADGGRHLTPELGPSRAAAVALARSGTGGRALVDAVSAAPPGALALDALDAALAALADRAAVAP